MYSNYASIIKRLDPGFARFIYPLGTGTFPRKKATQTNGLILAKFLSPRPKRWYTFWGD